MCNVIGVAHHYELVLHSIMVSVWVGDFPEVLSAFPV